MANLIDVRVSENPVVNPVAVDSPLSIEELTQPGLTAQYVMDDFAKHNMPITLEEAQAILDKERALAGPATSTSQKFIPDNYVPASYPRYTSGGSLIPSNASIEEQIAIQAKDDAIRKAREEAFTKELLNSSAQTQTGIGFSTGNSTGNGSGNSTGNGNGNGNSTGISSGYGIGTGGGRAGQFIGNFVDNPLDQYANYTYHLKLWITSQDHEEEVQNIVSSSTEDTKLAIDKIPKIIIAESGVTEGFGIKEFSFVNLVGTSPESRNNQDMTWSMVIMEPYGLSLPDKINSAAQQYGMLNWNRAKYYLQLYFTGYNEDGSPIATALFHKVFSLMIINMSLTATESGSVYDVKGIMDGGYGYSNEVAIVKAVVKLKDNTTVQQAINDLTRSLNENVKKIELTDIPTTSYEIKIPDFMKNWKIDGGKVQNNDSRSWKMDIKAGAAPEVTISTGTDILEGIRYLISRSPEAVAWETGKNSGQGGSSFESHGILKDLKVHSKVTYTNFDFYTGDYIKKITYTLYPYDQTRIATNIAQVRRAQDPALQQAKIDFLFSIGRIQKKYDWIFTGQNQNVIKFDLKINNFWVIAVPQYGGQNTNSNQSTPPIVGPDKTSDLQRRKLLANLEDAKKRADNAKSKLDAATATRKSEEGWWNKFLVNMVSSNSPELGFQLNQELEQTIATAKAEEALAQKTYEDFQAQQQNARTDPFIVPINRNPTMLNLADNVQAQKVVAGRVMLQEAASQQRLLFAEDQTILPMDPAFPITVKHLPEANISEGNQGTATPASEGNNPGAENPNRTLLGTAHGNLGAFNQENINIALDIRGDPYWMGFDNLTQNYQISNPSAPKIDYADYMGGDNMFYFNYRTGEGPNEDTGFMQFDNTSQTVAGYYIVMRVTNTFREGSFTQQLQSIKNIFTQNASDQPKITETKKTVVEQFVPTPDQAKIANEARGTTAGQAPLSQQDLINMKNSPNAPLSRKQREEIAKRASGK